MKSNYGSIRLAAICAVAAAILSLTPARAQITASTYNGGGTIGNYPLATGYRFAPTEDIAVTALGLYDHAEAGFIDRHEVGIFRSSDLALMSSAVLASGLSGTLIDGSRFVDVAPVTLTAGTSYYILGDQFTNDSYAYGDGAVSYAPQITWQGFVDGNAPGINAAPTFNSGVPGNLGPNFRFRTPGGEIPEPGTLALAFTGAVPLLGFLRRRRA